MLTVLQLVAAGDYVIHWRHPLAEWAEIVETAKRMRARKGRATIRMALPLLNDRAESPPESMTRVLLKWAGLPEPRINRDISGTSMAFIGRVDFVFDQLKVLIEYQGDYHRTDKDQWRKDMTRRSRLEAQGWKVMEITWDDLSDPGELSARIRALAALARR